jgi:nitrite reductase (NADH) large subunit
MPPFKGKELSGVHSIWTCEDIEALNKSLADTEKAVVIGGGLLGLESAHKISGMGIDVTLIEGMPRLLPKQLDEDGSEVFREKVESLGISVICGKAVAGFEGDDKGHVRYVRMNDDTLLDADVVVVTVGVAPNTAICQDSGMDIERFLIVNDKMETSIRDIYAAGDVACMSGRWFGQWSVASGQGQVAGTNAAGGDVVYKVTNVPYMLASMETRVVCSGDIGASQQDQSGDTYDINQTYDKNQFSYSRLVFRDGVFVGYVLIGEPSKVFNKLQSLIQTRTSAENINNILYES